MPNNGYSLYFDDVHVHVQRKAVKALRLVVKVSGEVRVSVPWFVPKFHVQDFVRGRLDWIRKQQSRFANLPLLPRVEMCNGEIHHVQGRPYTLQLIEQGARPRLELTENGRLNLYMSPAADVSQRLALLHAHYRRVLKREIPQLIAKWQPIMNVSVAEWGVKRMKTRWGTCNIDKRRIWLNLELAKYPPACLEYVVVHEMVHLLEAGHNARFKQFMDGFLPDWRGLEQTLNRVASGCLDM